MSRSLVIVGGNSSLASGIIELAIERQSFDKYVMLSFEANLKEGTRIRIFDDGITPISKGPISSLDNVLEDLCETSVSVIFCATYSAAAEYVRASVVQQSLHGVYAQALAISVRENQSFFFIGSNLAMVPFINRSKYKDIKYLELLAFDRLYIHLQQNFFVLTPPLKPAGSFLANAVGMERRDFVEELIEFVLRPKTREKYVVFGSRLSKALTKLFMFLFLLRGLFR